MSTRGMCRACASGFVVLLASCAFPLVTSAQPAWETLTLPHGISGKSEHFVGEDVYTGKVEPKNPFQWEYLEIHREWVRSELYEKQGSFGWQLRDFTMDTYDDSVTYNIKSTRGFRMNRLALYGNSRADGISPISWIRMLHVRSKLGEPVQVENKDGYTIYTCQGAGGCGKFRVYVESSGRVVRAEELSPGSEDVQGIYEYEDWISLGQAGEHPQTLRRILFGNENTPEWGTTYNVIRILEMEPLTKDAEPTGYTLRKEAIITDYIDGVIRDGDGNVIGDLSDATAATRVGNGSAMPFRLSSGWLAGGGVLLLVGAAVIWEVRRRRG